MIEYKDATVTVTIGEKEYSQSYPQIVKSSFAVEDLLQILSSDEKTAKQALSDYLYGFDLRKKAEVRNAILTREAGPEKAFERAVRDFMKLREAHGKPITEAKAREIVKLSMEVDAGVPA